MENINEKEIAEMDISAPETRTDVEEINIKDVVKNPALRKWIKKFGQQVVDYKDYISLEEYFVRDIGSNAVFLMPTCGMVTNARPVTEFVCKYDIKLLKNLLGVVGHNGFMGICKDGKTVIISTKKGNCVILKPISNQTP